MVVARLQLVVEAAFEGGEPGVYLPLLQRVRGVQGGVAGRADALSAGRQSSLHRLTTTITIVQILLAITR